jgi:hypothetical protein
MSNRLESESDAANAAARHIRLYQSWLAVIDQINKIVENAFNNPQRPDKKRNRRRKKGKR